MVEVSPREEFHDRFLHRWIDRVRCNENMDGHIFFETEGSIAFFIIDGPNDLNVMSPDMYHELHEGLLEFRDSPALRVGILTGAGTRAFSAGGDWKMAQSKIKGFTRAERFEHVWYPRSQQPARGTEGFIDICELELYKPVVGAVEGYCIGAGILILLLLADIRIVAADSTFGLNEVRMGVSGVAGHSLLARHVPLTTAMWMAMTGEPIDAGEAHRVGMVNEVVGNGNSLARAREIADRISKISPAVTRIEKELIKKTLDMSERDVQRLTWALQATQKFGHDYEEGYAAFLEKRDPTFLGW